MEVEEKTGPNKRDIIFGALAFWLLAFGIILIIWLNTVGFRLSPGKPLSIFGAVLLFYSPFYILTFLLIPRLSEKKIRAFYMADYFIYFNFSSPWNFFLQLLLHDWSL